MSDFQKNSSNFEDLCLKIVKKLLGNSLNKIAAIKRWRI